MEHATKEGGYKILKACKLPLTSTRCLHTICTDLAWIDVTRQLVLKELAPGETVESVQKLIEPTLKIDPGLKPMA